MFKYEVQRNDKLGRYITAAKDIRAGETILSDQPFVLGPHGDSALVCFNCYLPLINKFLVCKFCGVVPVCPGEGCPETIIKWHNTKECEFFRDLKLNKGLSPMTMVQNVGSLIVLRAILKKHSDSQMWDEFMQLETHLSKRRNTDLWVYYENTSKFIYYLGLLEDVPDPDLVQKVCAAIDVNSFEVRGPPIPTLGCAEILRAVYLKAALMSHDCIGNTHISINNNNQLICRASIDIKKGEPITYNYTDPLKGTELRQQHLAIGKYFKCTCRRCSDYTELGTYMSSAICMHCKEGYTSQTSPGQWDCNRCSQQSNEIQSRLQSCIDKFRVINKKDEKDLEEYIRNVSMVLAPNHYLLLDAKQRLAGVLRDTINREPHPTKKILNRKLDLCKELLSVLEILTPGIARAKAVTMYELHAATVQLSKKMFDAKEISASVFMDRLSDAESYLKRALEMLFIEPGNSPEGELCAKALEEYKALKTTINQVLDEIHAEGKAYKY